MTKEHENYCRELLVSIRKITRAIDLHSKYLKKEFGLTIPQLVILQEVVNRREISVTDLSRTIDLSQATVTDVVNRLVKNRFVSKEKSEKDKRMVMIKPLQKSMDLLNQAPPPLQEVFTRRFEALENWEQQMLLSSLQRIVSMMSAQAIDAAPILVAGPIAPGKKATGQKTPE